MRFGGANKLNRKSGEKAPSVLFCAKEPVVAEPRWKALEINHYRPTYTTSGWRLAPSAAAMDPTFVENSPFEGYGLQPVH